MKTGTDHGLLVLADISGFTRFVTATELEHGAQIIADLLEAVVRELAPPLRIQEIEGDAVFAVGDGQAASGLLELLQDAFAAFKHRQRQLQLQADDGCDCGACRTVSVLDLKLVAHHGRFLRQRVGGHDRLAGADVILAHRLLKNGWRGGRAYVLLTEAAARWAAVDPDRAGLTAHTERYDHLGDVRCFVKDLAPQPVAA